MELSKESGCIPHKITLENLHASRLTTEVLTFLYFYLKRRQQRVRLNDAGIIFKILLSEVPQSSILVPILPNIFIIG